MRNLNPVAAILDRGLSTAPRSRIAATKETRPLTSDFRSLISVLCLLSAVLCLPSSGLATDREFSKTWKVDTSATKKWNLDLFQGDSVCMNITSTQEGDAFDLTGATVILEIRGWDDYTNLYAVATGTVVSATAGTSRFKLTPTQTANLSEGTYLGYAKAIISDGTNITDRVVLAYHRIKTEWSAVALDYDVVGPLPAGYVTQADLTAVSNAVAASITAISNRMITLEDGTNNWSTAYEWGDHAIAGYLTSFTELDPAWTAGTNAIWDAIAGATDTNALQISVFNIYTNATETRFQGLENQTNLIQSAVQPTDSDYITALTQAAAAATTTALADEVVARDVAITASHAGWSFSSERIVNTVDYYGRIDLSSDGANALYAGSDDFNYTQGFQGVKLGAVAGGDNFVNLAQFADASIELYRDTVILGKLSRVTDPAPTTGGTSVGDRDYNDARYTGLNAPITITNDAAWTRWTTTGDLTVSNRIYLTVAETLLSPLQTNGIADYDVSHSGSFSPTVSAVVGAVAVSLPYYGADAQLKIELLAPVGLPGQITATTITEATIVGYEDRDEASVVKYVSGLCRIEKETLDCDVTRKIYVDEGDAASVATAAGSLASYAVDPDKTLRGAELRLGNMWVVSPADASGERWICSGGEISGTGELVGTTNEFVIAKNDYPLMSFTSSASGLFITNYTMAATASNVTVSLFVATNGVTAAPFAEWAESLTVGEWSRVLAPTVDTYPAVSNGTYELTFTLPLANTMYFRAMQPIGESTAIINADVFFLKYSKLLINDATGVTWRIAVSTNGAIIVTAE